MIFGLLVIGAIMLGLYYFQSIEKQKNKDLPENFFDNKIFNDKVNKQDSTGNLYDFRITLSPSILSNINEDFNVFIEGKSKTEDIPVLKKISVFKKEALGGSFSPTFFCILKDTTEYAKEYEDIGSFLEIEPNNFNLTSTFSCSAVGNYNFVIEIEDSSERIILQVIDFYGNDGKIIVS